MHILIYIFIPHMCFFIKDFNKSVKKDINQPLLFGLEKKFISDDELFFDEKHFYAIDKEKKKATFWNQNTYKAM